MSNAQPGQIFTSGGGGLTPPPNVPGAPVDATLLRYQPSCQVPEDLLGDKLAFDMARAGHTPLGWTRPARDLYFVLQQPGIDDRCRAHRILDENASQQDLARALFLCSMRQIGDVKGVDLGDDFVNRWLDDIGLPGMRLVDLAYQKLAHPTQAHEDAFTATRTWDPQARTTGYTIPAECLPAASSAAERSFALRELTLKQTADAAEAAEDIDQGHEVRVLQIMWSIARIGSRVLTLSPEDLLIRRRWLSQIGSRGYMMVAGTYSRMHEVERGLADRFLDAAAPPA